MLACDVLRVLDEDYLPRRGEMTLEDCARSAEGNGFSVEQSGVERKHGFQIENTRMFLRSGLIERGKAVDVRGSADHRLPSGNAGDAPGQPVGPSEMS